MYSLCKNNDISKKVLNKLQAFHFRSTVYTNTTSTMITHSYVFQNHRSATIMVLKFELRCVEQIVTSASFWPKKGKCWNFEDDCVPNVSTDQVAAWGVLIYSWNMMFSDKMQNFFFGIEAIIFKKMLQMIMMTNNCYVHNFFLLYAVIHNRQSRQ